MKKRKSDSASWRSPGLTVIMTVVMLLLLTVTAWARYQFSETYSQPFAYQTDTSRVYLLSNEPGSDGNYQRVGDWKQIENTGSRKIYTLDFTIANGTGSDSYGTYDQNAALSLILTAGAQTAANYTITLSANGQEYTAVASDIKNGSVLYKNYGAGWVYRFYAGNGEELTWPLTGGRFTKQDMTLTVTGASAYPSVLELVVSGVQSD